MKKLILILICFCFYKNICSQTKVVGKIEFHKFFEDDKPELVSSGDVRISQLNSKPHYIEFRQKDSIFSSRTDSTGYFHLTLEEYDTLYVNVWPKSNVLNKSFTIEPSQLLDTIRLKISDRKIACYRDSIQAPKFFTKYNTEQAILDFKKGEAQILISGAFPPPDYEIRRRKSLEEKYGFKYVAVFGCIVSQAELRIAYRYNKTMQKLIGAENVW